MTEDDIKDVALMALHGDLDGVDIPGPTENAVKEALRIKVCIYFFFISIPMYTLEMNSTHFEVSTCCK